VVAIYVIDSSDCRVDAVERKETVADGSCIGKISVLNNYGTTRSEVTNRTVADPTTTHFDVAMFRDAEFGTRLLDEFAIGLWSFRNDFAGYNFPAVSLEAFRINTHLRQTKGLFC